MAVGGSAAEEGGCEGPFAAPGGGGGEGGGEATPPNPSR